MSESNGDSQDRVNDNTVPDTETPAERRVVFVHGRRPKPPASLYRPALWRCLLEGVRRADPGTVDALSSHPECFVLAPWSDLFYSSQRDFELDRPAIESLLSGSGPTAADRAEARSWTRRIKRSVYSIGDRFPWLVEHFADPWIRDTVADARRYIDDRDGLGHAVRDRVRGILEDAAAQCDRLMIIGHSLGSVVVYDALWELTHVHGRPLEVDWLLTLGSPLGTRFVHRGLSGRDRAGAERYPHGIRHWRNFTTEGDLAALDPTVEDDFAPMLEHGLLESLADNGEPMYGSFRNEAGLNVHRSYGYLVQPAVGRVVSGWIKEGGSK